MHRPPLIPWMLPLLLTAGAFAGCLQPADAAAEPAAVAPAGDAACDEEAARIRDRLAHHLDDPFGERPPFSPSLVDCSEAGALQLAAFGLEGEDALRLTLRFDGERTCAFHFATGGPSPRSHLGVWQEPAGATSGWLGAGGSSIRASVGPLDTQNVESRGGWGSSAIGGRERAFTAGEHNLYLASSNWGAVESELTGGAALALLLACDGPFAYGGAAGAEQLSYFDRHEGAAAAGVTAHLVGAGAARAVDARLPDGGELVVAAGMAAGGGILQKEDADGASRTPLPPLSITATHEEVPPGPLTLTLAGGGAFALWAGFAVSPWQPLEPAAFLGG